MEQNNNNQKATDIKNVDEKGLNTAKPAMGNTNSMDDKVIKNLNNGNDHAGENKGGQQPEDSHKELANDPKDVKGRRNGSDSNSSDAGDE